MYARLIAYVMIEEKYLYVALRTSTFPFYSVHNTSDDRENRKYNHPKEECFTKCCKRKYC